MGKTRYGPHPQKGIQIEIIFITPHNPGTPPGFLLPLKFRVGDFAYPQGYIIKNAGCIGIWNLSFDYSRRAKPQITFRV